MYHVILRARFFVFLFFSLSSLSMEEKNVPWQDTSNKATVRILSIDGGGLRGVIAARIAEGMEIALTTEFTKPIHLADYFDVIAGTSTGALIALGLSTIDPETKEYYTASKVKKFYMDAGPKIFPASGSDLWNRAKQVFKVPFNTGPLKTELEAYFYKNLMLNTLKPHIIIPAYEMQTNVCHVFDSHDAINDKNKNYSVIDIALSTTAAPTFLKSHEFKNDSDQDKKVFADGGLFANNPAWLALSKALVSYPKAKEFYIFSLGTGETPKEDLSDLSDKGKKAWAPHLFSIMSGSAKNLVDSNIELQKELLSRHGIKITYKRIQNSLTEKLKKMTNPNNLDALAAIGWKVYEESADVKDILENIRNYFEKDRGLTRQKLEHSKKDHLKLIIQNQLKENCLDLSGGIIDDIILESGSIGEIFQEFSINLETKISHIYLNISANEITFKGIPYLINLLKEYPQFIGLILDNCDLGKQGLETLVNLIISHKININWLSLSAINFEKDELTYIVKLLGNTSSSFEIYLGGDVSEFLKEGDNATQRALLDNSRLKKESYKTSKHFLEAGKASQSSEPKEYKTKRNKKEEVNKKNYSSYQKKNSKSLGKEKESLDKEGDEGKKK